MAAHIGKAGPVINARAIRRLWWCLAIYGAIRYYAAVPRVPCGARPHSILAPEGKLRYYSAMSNSQNNNGFTRSASMLLDEVIGLPATAQADNAVDVAFVRPAAKDLYAQDGDDFFAPATSSSAGFDLRACLDEDESVIAPGQRLKIGTGIAVQPRASGIAGFVYSRSGLGARDGLTVAQGVGVIDPDYTGEILVVLLNTSGQERRVAKGERIAQLIFQPFMRPNWREVTELTPTERGSGGFGHTGR